MRNNEKKLKPVTLYPASFILFSNNEKKLKPCLSGSQVKAWECNNEKKLKLLQWGRDWL